ncbi:MAG: hypothetical protein ACK2T1_06515 [Candidatus Promineifilaceae bacterium]
MKIASSYLSYILPGRMSSVPDDEAAQKIKSLSKEGVSIEDE